jgi:hypothetical protein
VSSGGVELVEGEASFFTATDGVGSLRVSRGISRHVDQTKPDPAAWVRWER